MKMGRWPYRIMTCFCKEQFNSKVRTQEAVAESRSGHRAWEQSEAVLSALDRSHEFLSDAAYLQNRRGVPNCCGRQATGMPCRAHFWDGVYLSQAASKA